MNAQARKIAIAASGNGTALAEPSGRGDDRGRSKHLKGAQSSKCRSSVGAETASEAVDWSNPKRAEAPVPSGRSEETGRRAEQQAASAAKKQHAWS